MDAMNAVEWFGLVASVIVAYSLMLKDMLKLRCWNLIGAVMFAVYGALIGALPVLVLNVFISIADIYYIIKIRQAAVIKRD
ncbi:MAG: YgjV family protein [Gammaproteobacteria bacterium]|nr:YgjV family protein [Gammaproteobacteria bacterium]